MILFMITTGSLNSQDILGFLNKQDMISQVNIYVMDFIWKLCDVYVSEAKIQGFLKLLYEFVT